MREVVIALHGLMYILLAILMGIFLLAFPGGYFVFGPLAVILALAGINECIDAKRAATKRDKRGE